MRRPAVGLSLVLALALGCAGGSADPGLRAALRVEGAQFLTGALPAAAGGPGVVTATLSRSVVGRGETQLHLTGAFDPTGTVVEVWLEGDSGGWRLEAGLPDVSAPTQPTLAAVLEVALDAPLGAHTLWVLARDAQGRAGPAAALSLDVLPVAAPSGVLVVSLGWDTNADLDLHLVDASGVEIWAGSPNSWKPPRGGPLDPNAWKQGGILDVDSNANCVIDGRNQENVVWQLTPPSGHYEVRVDTTSLCGQSAARWVVSATLDGGVLASAEGISTPAATRPPHGLGAGVTAATFDVP